MGGGQPHLAKHSVDFRHMPALFDGPTLEAVDDRHHYRETRFNALGEIEGRVFFVTLHVARQQPPHHQRKESQ